MIPHSSYEFRENWPNERHNFTSGPKRNFANIFYVFIQIQIKLITKDLHTNSSINYELFSNWWSERHTSGKDVNGYKLQYQEKG
jgi:hypothetical protein